MAAFLNHAEERPAPCVNGALNTSYIIFETNTMSLEFAAVPAAAAASGRQNPMVDSDLPTRMAREEFNIQDLIII